MDPVLDRIEKLADALIAPALLVILVIVILELFFAETAHHYDVWLNFADFMVILVFVTDLSFKFQRAARWKGFLKDYWLEIIAIIPVFWVFRIVELVAAIQTAEIGQEAIHLGTRSERFAAVFRSSELAREARLARFLRFVSRSPRFAMAAKFFQEPGEN